MKRRTIIFGGAGLLAITATAWLAWQSTSRRAPAANRAVSLSGSATPKVTANPGALYAASLPDLAGNTIALSQLKGRPVVANFWATWCAPCVEEMPHLDALSKSLPNIQFVGIGIDTAANIAQFVTKIPVSYPLYVAGHAGIGLVRELGNAAGGLPFTVLLDAEGHIFDTILGQVSLEDLQKRIDRLVAKSKT
ncbi:MAG: TlpA family protein disulfide reductase [Burkholderiaceae bacterium]|nr:TlpA family protein disulfide reductase [Burkholderiaceae bacterium]